MNLNFINTLNESNQYRTKDALAKTSARVLADHAFIDTISLWILYNEFDYAPVAIKYAQKTTRYSDFSSYQQASTDLYLSIHAIVTKKTDTSVDSERDRILLDRIDLDESKMLKFFRLIQNNTAKDFHAKQFLLDLERALNITESNYRSVRRLAQNWGLLDNTQKSLVITRITQFYRAHAPKSELYHLVTALQKKQGLEIEDAKDAEKTKSRSLSTASKLALIGGAAGASFMLGRQFGKSLI